MTTIDTRSDTYNETLTRYVELAIKESDLEAELKRCRQDMATLEPALIDAFVQYGRQRDTILGRTVYLSTTLRPRVVDKDALFQALNAAGMGDLVQETVNQNSLGARLREYVRDAIENGTEYANIGPAPIPPELTGVVELNPIVDLRVVRAS